jgi:serine/threonine protein phosphatase PrpC
MAAAISKLPLRVGAKSHPGKVRSENQDRMSRFTAPLGEVFIVADGMGGHKGGATAAAMTIDGFERSLRAASSRDSAKAALLEATQQTNAEIYRLAHSGDPTIAKMGSTVVLALVSGEQIIIGHAGDSRAYLYRDGELQRLTRDHSAVQRMLDHHLLTEEEARDHPDANIISRAFGQKPELELEISPPFNLQPGDGVLLCSDGLCGYVDDAAIERALGAPSDAQKITDALIKLALEAGGEDNITVQFLQFGARNNPAVVESSFSAEQDELRKPNQRRWRLIVALMVVGAFLLGMLATYAPGWIRAWRQSRAKPAASAAPPGAPADAPKQAESDQKNRDGNQEQTKRPAEGPAPVKEQR